MKKALVFIYLLAAFFPLLSAAEEIPLSIEEAVAIALRDNRDILLKAQDLEKAKAKIAEAKAGLYPTLNFTGTWSDTRGLYAKDLTQATTQTTLKQYLYKGGKTVNTIKSKGYDFEVSQALLDKEKLETILSVTKAFYALALAEEFSRLNQGILDNSQKHLAMVKEQYNKGELSSSEVLKTEVSLFSVEKACAESLNQRETAGALLNNLLYLDHQAQIKPAAKLDYQPEDSSFDQELLAALKKRPEIRQYEAQGKSDQKAIEIAKAETRPQVYAAWDYYSRSHLTATTSRNWNDHNIIGLTFSWPIFDGWATRAKVEQAIADLKISQLNQEKTNRDIALEVKNAYIALKNAVLQIASQDADIKVYTDNLATLKEKYSQGLSSALDMDDAQLKYEISLFNKNQAVYDCMIARCTLEKATGGT